MKFIAFSAQSVLDVELMTQMFYQLTISSQLEKNRKLTIDVYREIMKNPDEAKQKYQLLCRNCNWKKMIENNERNKHHEPYAYEWQLQAMYAQLMSLIDSKLKLEQNRKRRQINEEELSLEKLYSLVKPYADLYTFNGTVNATKLRVTLLSKLGIKIGHNKAYTLKTFIEFKQKEIESQLE